MEKEKQKNKKTQISPLQKRVDAFMLPFGEESDVVTRKFYTNNLEIIIIYVDDMADTKMLESGVIIPVSGTNNFPQKNISQFLMDNVIRSVGCETSTDEAQMINQLLSGCGLVFVDGDENVLIVTTPGFEKRSIIEPPTSAVLKGPREGFTENIATNISLVRRRLKSKELIVQKKKIGKQSQTDIAIMYMKNIADQKIVDEINKRLSKIEIDGIVDSYYIQSLIGDSQSGLFKQMGSTEKPDVIMAKLMEGRVAIIVDGSPMVITVPFLFIEDLQSGDDYYNHASRATFVRFIRVVGLMIGILLPGLYVATQIFHYRILPLSFFISLRGSVQGIAFPPLIEILFVLTIFEVLNEASLRMPKYLGMALSVIGALVLGDTAVKAGLISPPAVLVVAISGITIYTVPEQVSIMSLLRLIMTVVGGIAGYYGILIASILLVAYMAGLESYGTPYLAPYAPSVPSDKKDGILKHGLQNMIKRPKSFPNKNRVRLRLEDEDNASTGDTHAPKPEGGEKS